MATNSGREASGAIARYLKSVGAGGSQGADMKDARSACLRAGLTARDASGDLSLTDAGRAWLARYEHQRTGDSAIGDFRAQHLHLSRTTVLANEEPQDVLVNDSESPLAWLASRKGRDGRTMIDAAQFAAGERLRLDFTRAHLTPRVTSNWSAPTGSSGTGAGEITDVIVAARQRVNSAMEAVGPEFSGVLLDVCCFLHGLEQVERERNWPLRSGKVVLQLALDRLARHYGLAAAVRGSDRSRITRWAVREPVPAD